MRKARVAKPLRQPAPVASDGNSNNEEAHRARQRLVVCHRTDKWATIDCRTRDICLRSSLSGPRHARLPGGQEPCGILDSRRLGRMPCACLHRALNNPCVPPLLKSHLATWRLTRSRIQKHPACRSILGILAQFLRILWRATDNRVGIRWDLRPQPFERPAQSCFGAQIQLVSPRPVRFSRDRTAIIWNARSGD